uniref:Uncharacterized protein n=1 Tax=Ditylenchus dipsaci TaxID=166011 RepID=A0A915DMS5_9BILA
MSVSKKIDVGSGSACHSGLNIFTVPPTNVSVNKSVIREILPVNTIDESPYEFRVFSDNQWIDLSKTYLYLELALQKRTGNNWVPLVAADVDVAPVQALGQSFIRQLKVHINGTEVYDSTNLYPYLSYIKNELTYSKDVKSSLLASTGYYNEDQHDNAADSGYVKRCATMANSQVCEYISLLDFDLANQSQYLLNNLNLHFTIYKSDDSFMIQKLSATDNNVYRVNLLSIKMYVKTIEVQNSLNLNVLTMLEKQSAKYPLRKTEIRSCFLSAGRTQITYNAFSNIVPRRLLVTFVSNEAFNGSFRLSPFNFKPFDLRELTVNAGGINYPTQPYNMNFTGDRLSYMRAFVDMHNSSVPTENMTNGITIDKFLSGWTFFVIPLSSTLEDCGGFELIKNGTTTVSALFNTAIPNPGVTMLIIGEFDQLLSIDYNRVIMSDGSV